MEPRSATASTETAFGIPLAHSRVPSIGSTATSTAGPVPSPTSSPLNSIGASVLLALADHHDAAHGHGVDERAHGVHRRAVRPVLVAASHPAGGGHGRRLGHPRELQGQVPVRRVLGRLGAPVTPSTLSAVM